MRLFLLVAAGAALLPAAEPNTLTPAEKASGWRMLFDGKSFQGWDDPGGKQPPGRSWMIEDGCIKARPAPGLREDLFTKDSFGDFELVFEWKISAGGNSGLKYRIQDRFFLDERKLRSGKYKRFEDLANEAVSTRATARAAATQEYIVGFEYQVIDDGGHADARRGGLYQAGALYGMSPIRQNAAKPVGEFNVSRVVVRGKHVEHWLNGVKVVETDLDAGDGVALTAKRWTTASPIYQALSKVEKLRTPIALQNHNDAVWFRSLKIRELK